MPIIYLSPSTQESNAYVTGSGSEEFHMNRLADAMIPYLNSCGIRYVRNTPEMTAGSSIQQANQSWYDFYLALHSNAAAEENYGTVRGIIAFHYPGSTQGQRAAQTPMPPLCCWRSAITTMCPTRGGLRATPPKLPGIWSSVLPTSSTSPLSGLLTLGMPRFTQGAEISISAAAPVSPPP